MFFNDVNKIMEIAEKNGCGVFVVPAKDEVKIPRALVLEPEEKSLISIDQVRGIMDRLNLRQIGQQFIIIRPADKLGEEAANALLKRLEEPNDGIHFVLVTENIAKILPTILSRAAVYFLRSGADFKGEIVAEEKVKLLAKKFIVAKPAELVLLAEEVTKKKDGVRAYALEVLAVAIEMLYKSYLMTSKKVFIEKIPKFLLAYDNISENGHIKLHLVADLL
ncbi:MAG: hypothetical protein Q4A79_01250 [Candidatus Saccharibacteria bacterium]|nr:hypothetical protein [Candidatus Saccharibacteria bacterium]